VSELEQESFRPARSIGIGLALALGINLAVPYTQHSLGSSSMTAGHIHMAVIIPYLFLVLVVNALLRLTAPRVALRSGELVVVFTLSVVGSSVADLVGRFIATISAPYYFASQENHWAEFFHQYLQPWMLPTNEGNAIKWLYEGLPKGESIPWAVWIGPLFWWFLFLMAITVGVFSLVVMLRKQWVERERLSFPIARVAVELAQQSTGPSRVAPLLRNRLFWAGFAIPFGILCWNMAGWFYPQFPAIGFATGRFSQLTLNPDFPTFYPMFNFMVLGFAYFTNLEILFSIWLFHILAILQAGVVTRSGLGPALGLTEGGVGPQSNGALFFFVFWGLWMARRQLADVWRKFIDPRAPVDDSREFFSYRTAVVGFVGAAVFLVFWLHRAGMSYWYAMAFLAASLVLYLGMAKIIATSGLVFLRSPDAAQGLLSTLWPKHFVDDSTLSISNTMFACYSGNKGWLAPSAFHAGKLSESTHLDPRALGRALLVGLALSLIVGALSTIYLGYKVGAFNFGSYAFTNANQHVFDYIPRDINAKSEPWDPKLGQYGFFGFGIAVMGLLTMCSYRLSWWPIHPIGFIVPLAFPVRASALSVFVAWAAKSVILRIGGIALYRKSQPFFLGIIAGYVAGIALGLLVDVVLFPGQGHGLYWD